MEGLDFSCGSCPWPPAARVACPPNTDPWAPHTLMTSCLLTLTYIYIHSSQSFLLLSTSFSYPPPPSAFLGLYFCHPSLPSPPRVPSGTHLANTYLPFIKLGRKVSVLLTTCFGWLSAGCQVCWGSGEGRRLLQPTDSGNAISTSLFIILLDIVQSLRRPILLTW